MFLSRARLARYTRSAPATVGPALRARPVKTSAVALRIGRDESRFRIRRACRAASGAKGLDHTAKSEIVRFSSAAREDHVAQARANEVGHVLPGRFDGLLCLPPIGMLQAGGVAELFAEERQHRVHHLRVAGCGRVRVEVEAGHWD